MTRLPVPGSDQGTWGTILNDFLGVAHNADGSLQPASVVNAGAVTSVNTKLPASGNVTLSANDIGAPTTLAADTDVTISSPSDGQVLTYNAISTKWHNQTSGTIPSLDDIYVLTYMEVNP